MKASIQQLFGLLASVLAVQLVSGCASRLDAQHPWDKGWRLGKVEAVGDQSGRVTVHTDCRERLGREWPYPQVAVVSYSYGGSPTLRQNRLVGVLPQTSLTPGDAVFIKIDDCSVPLETSTTGQ